MAYTDPDTLDTEAPETDAEAPADPFEVIRYLQRASQMDTLAEEIEDAELAQIGNAVQDEYRLDKRSMGPWFEKMEAGLKLAKMLREDKQSVGKLSNVMFPLVASAALQYNARAYPAIVTSDGPVKCAVRGKDPQGLKAKRGERVAEYTNFQLLSQISEWERQTDLLTLQVSIVGKMFRKLWYDPAKGRSRFKLCMPGKIIVHDKVASIEDAPRVTEELELYPHEITERVNAGLFRDLDYTGGQKDEADGDPDAALLFIEQHRRWDIDGDGYPEPYVVTVCERSGEVARIAANWTDDDVHLEFDDQGEPTGRVLSIDANTHFVGYDFLPSLDGGFWSTGFGMLLGDLSHAINSIINILVDSGHRSSLGGGWIGTQNFRLKGGPEKFGFGEWKMVNFTGNDIRAGVVPLQFAEPSPTLFQMLGLLIEAGREIASVNDVMTGDVQRNMTAYTTAALIEQGMALFTASYKRIYKGLSQEFRLLLQHNARYVSDEEYSAFHDEVGPDGQPMRLSAQEEFSLTDMDITPVADPKQVTNMQRMAKGQMLMEMAALGDIDPREAQRRVLEAAGIEDIDELLPEPDPLVAQLALRQAQHADMMMALERSKAEIEIGEMMAGIEKDLASAAKDHADVALAGRRHDLDAMKVRLQGLMAVVKQAGAANDGRGPGSMAGQPGNGAALGPAGLAGELGAGQPVPGMVAGPGGQPGPGMPIPGNGGLGG